MLIKTVELADYHSDAWQAIAAVLLLKQEQQQQKQQKQKQQQQTVTINNNITFSRTECLMKAVSYDEKNPYLWLQLGNSLISGSDGFWERNNTSSSSFFKNSIATLIQDDGDEDKGEEVINNNNNNDDEAEEVEISNEEEEQKEKETEEKSVSKNNNNSTATTGRFLSKLDCYLRSLTLAPTFSVAWSNIGILLDSDEKIRFNNKVYFKKDCLFEALKFSAPLLSSTLQSFSRNAIRENSGFWNALGDSISSNNNNINNDGGDDKETVEVDQGVKKFSKKDCYVKALELNPNYSDVWGKLGVLLLSISDSDSSGTVVEVTVEISEKYFTAKECLQKAVETDYYYYHDFSDNSISFQANYNLGLLLEPEEKIHISPPHSDGNGDVLFFSAKDLFLRSLQISSNNNHQQPHCSSWLALGNILKIKMSTSTVDETISLPSCLLSNESGCTSTTTKENQEKVLLLMSKKDLYVEAIRCGEKQRRKIFQKNKNNKKKKNSQINLMLSSAYYNLAIALKTPKQQIVIEGFNNDDDDEKNGNDFGKATIDQKSALIFAILRDETNSDAFFYLGHVLKNDEYITLNSKSYGRMECFEEFDRLEALKPKKEK